MKDSRVIRSKYIISAIKEALVIHPSSDHLFVDNVWSVDKSFNDLSDKDLHDFVDSLSDDEFIDFANEYLGGIYIDDDGSEDGQVGFGIIDDKSDAKMRSELAEGKVANKRRPGEMHYSHGSITRGPKYRMHLTGADKIKASLRFKKLRRSGSFKAKQQLALRRLRRSPRFRSFMHRVMKARHPG